MNTAVSVLSPRTTSTLTSTLYTSFCAYEGADGRDLYAVAVFLNAKGPRHALGRNVIAETIARLDLTASGHCVAKFPGVGTIADVCREDPEAYTGRIDGALRVLAAPGSITGLNALLRELRGMAGVTDLAEHCAHLQHYVMAGKLPDGNVDARPLSPYTTCLELAELWLAEIRVNLPSACIATFSATFGCEADAANDGSLATSSATQTA